eukprot:SAG22_NODE_508_length_9621_cov_30.889414_3_plen_570_part_00
MRIFRGFLRECDTFSTFPLVFVTLLTKTYIPFRRGILVTTRGKVRISNNTIHTPLRPALHIADDAANWYESGPVTDVEFSGNLVLRNHSTAGSHAHQDSSPIDVAPSNTKNATVHRGLRILKNEIHLHQDSKLPVVTAKSIAGVTLEGNRIFSPGRALTLAQMVSAANCSDVVVTKDNTVITSTSTSLTPLKSDSRWAECAFDAVGDFVRLGKCLSCSKECDKDVWHALTKLKHGDLDPAEWLKAAHKCDGCVSPCSNLTQLVVTSACLLGKAECHTDFCATCCGKNHTCAGNDFNIDCTPLGRQCVCGNHSGNPNSCCTSCAHDEHSCGGGHGKNTGNYCGNDFHSAACGGTRPVCCTNDVGKPACCAIGQNCHSPLLGNNGCVNGSTSQPARLKSDDDGVAIELASGHILHDDSMETSPPDCRDGKLCGGTGNWVSWPDLPPNASSSNPGKIPFPKSKDLLGWEFLSGSNPGYGGGDHEATLRTLGIQAGQLTAICTRLGQMAACSMMRHRVRQLSTGTRCCKALWRQEMILMSQTRRGPKACLSAMPPPPARPSRFTLHRLCRVSG